MSVSQQSDTGMELRDLLEDEAFARRPVKERERYRDALALRRLARIFAEAPERVLQELVDAAVEFCGADSAGISLEERNVEGDEVFRWIVVSGSFSKFLDGLAPRYYSPCGTCLDSGRPKLYSVTQPYYEFLGVTADTIHEGMLIPWASGDRRGTLWAVSHREGETFDIEDYRFLDSLADFASIIIQQQTVHRSETHRQKQAASDATANRLAHRINNPLQSLTNTLYLAREGKGDTQAYIAQAAADVGALSELVRELLAATGGTRQVLRS